MPTPGARRRPTWQECAVGSAARVLSITTLCLAVAFGGALVPAGGAAGASERPSYGWPLKPCDRQHAVRGHLGAPRTIFTKPLEDAGLHGPGRVSFHNGVDIVARAGKAVYPVVSGEVRRISGGLAVVTDEGREFRYQHITRVARPGQHVIACRSVLGYVQERKEHLHFVEVDRGKVVNPLARGRMTPYVDTTKPRVESLRLIGADAQGLGEVELQRQAAAQAFHARSEPLTLRGRVRVSARVHDLPTLPVEWPTEWAQMETLPLVPTRVELTLRPVGTSRVAYRLRSRANFRNTVPDNDGFWRVYRRGTHQNWPVIGGLWHKRMPGTYLFRLPWLETRHVPNGRYVLKLAAYDSRGNRGWIRVRVRVKN